MFFLLATKQQLLLAVPGAMDEPLAAAMVGQF